MRSFVSTCSPAAVRAEVKYAFVPKANRQISSSTDATDALIWTDRLLKMPISDWIPEDSFELIGRSGGVKAPPHSSLPVNSDTYKVISHLFDVARLVFDLVVDRIRPLVIDPAASRPIGNIGQLLNEIFSVLILKAKQILAD